MVNFWFGEYAEEATHIISCESSCDEEVVGKRVHHGLFQFTGYWMGTGGRNLGMDEGWDWRNPYQNIKMGWLLFEHNQHCWSCNDQWPKCGKHIGN